MRDKAKNKLVISMWEKEHCAQYYYKKQDALFLHKEELFFLYRRTDQSRFNLNAQSARTMSNKRSLGLIRSVRQNNLQLNAGSVTKKSPAESYNIQTYTY